MPRLDIAAIVPRTGLADPCQGTVFLRMGTCSHQQWQKLSLLTISGAAHVVVLICTAIWRSTHWPEPAGQISKDKRVYCCTGALLPARHSEGSAHPFQT